MKWSEYIYLEKSTVTRWFRNFLINCLPDFWIINRVVRPALARFCGMQCGSGVMLQKDIFYGNPKNVQIGNKSSIGRGAFLDGFDKILIGDNVIIAFGVTFITSNHEMGNKEKRTGKVFGSPIVVGNGVWIAARAIIGPGTEIGAGSMIASGAVLMQSVPMNSLVTGAQAKVIMQMASGESSNQLFELSTAPADISETENVLAAPKPSSSETRKNFTMTRLEFYTELTAILKLERGSIQGTEILAELPSWDSLAVLSFIAMADAKLHVLLSPDVLAACETVPDLMNMLQGKITEASLQGVPVK
jgi:maltose O-acetyltransferase